MNYSNEIKARIVAGLKPIVAGSNMSTYEISMQLRIRRPVLLWLRNDDTWCMIQPEEWNKLNELVKGNISLKKGEVRTNPVRKPEFASDNQVSDDEMMIRPVVIKPKVKPLERGEAVEPEIHVLRVRIGNKKVKLSITFEVE